MSIFDCSFVAIQDWLFVFGISPVNLNKNLLIWRLTVFQFTKKRKQLRSARNQYQWIDKPKKISHTHTHTPILVVCHFWLQFGILSGHITEKAFQFNVFVNAEKLRIVKIPIFTLVFQWKRARDRKKCLICDFYLKVIRQTDNFHCFSLLIPMRRRERKKNEKKQKTVEQPDRKTQIHQTVHSCDSLDSTTKYSRTFTNLQLQYRRIGDQIR